MLKISLKKEEKKDKENQKKQEKMKTKEKKEEKKSKNILFDLQNRILCLLVIHSPRSLINNWHFLPTYLIY